MSLNDPLANALSMILNADKKGIRAVTIQPTSKTLKEVLRIMKENQYLGDAETVTEEKGGIIKLNLLGNVNKCGAIKPRFSITKKNFERFEKRYLPAKGFGLLVVTTSKGIMSHKEALTKGIGGKLLAYCY